MKKYLLSSIVLSAVAYAGPTLAQDAAAGNACDSLMRYVEENRDTDIGMTPAQLQVLRERGDQQRCLQVLAEVGHSQDDGDASIVVEQAAPSVRVDQAEPNITVRQPQPNVAVTQGQPDILVRQPAPQVTVFVPQPEIIVRMPEPDVRVSQAQPEVQVSQPQPKVEVIQPDQQARVLTERNQQADVRILPAGEANVQLQNSGQPNVRYEAEEAQVSVQRAEGQPEVRYERTNEQAAAGAEQRTQQAFETAETQQNRQVNPAEETGAVSATGMQSILVSDLTDVDVVNARGNQLGDVEAVAVSTADNRILAIISHGGFLGLGEKRVAIPLENMAMMDDRLVVRGLTDDDIRAMPEWNEQDPNYRRLEDNQQAEVSIGN